MKSPFKTCLIFGCAGALILALLIGGVVAIFAYTTFSKLKSFTSDTPMEITVPAISEDDEVEAVNKYEELERSVEGDVATKVSFSAKDLNALITKSDIPKNLKGRFFIQIEGDEIKAEGSFPLDDIPGFGGRFFNGKVSLDVSMRGGVLWVTPKALSAGDKTAPQDIINAFQSKNLAMEGYKNPESAKILNKLANVSVKDGELIIETKGNKPKELETE